MIVGLPRRWRWVVAGGCGLIVLMAIAFVLFARATTARQEAVAGPLSPPVAVLPASPVRPAVATPDDHLSATAAVTHGLEEVEVCGMGWLAQPAVDALTDQAAHRDSLAAARERVLVNMRSDGRELTRAAAMLLQSVNGLAPARDDLVDLALATSDPAVYGLAFRHCAKHRAGPGRCPLLSAERWAQLDPQNAAPWSYILADAAGRGDTAAQGEALHRIASAGHLHGGFLVSAAAVLDALPDDDASQLAGVTLVVDAIGLEAAVMPGYPTLLAGCGGDWLKNANRLQTCARIAEVLTMQSDTLLDDAVGRALGRRIGWPAARVEALDAQARAYLSSGGVSLGFTDDMSCDGIRRTFAGLRHSAAVGEAGAMREWLAQSGRSPEDFVREVRERSAAVAKSSASAASGA